MTAAAAAPRPPEASASAAVQAILAVPSAVHERDRQFAAQLAAKEEAAEWVELLA